MLNYTTKIEAAKTVSEIQAMLGKGGASAVATMYEDGRPTGVTFVLQLDAGPATFALPVDVTGVQVALRRMDNRGGLSRAVMESPAHAERVAWRVVKDWLEAQLALVEARMARLDVVMLPYLVVDGLTVGERYLEQGQKALGAGS